jgi:hypothetical protein
MGKESKAALAGLAASIVKEWHDEQKARRSIARLFRGCCLDEEGEVRRTKTPSSLPANLTFLPGIVGPTKVAGLVITIDPEPRGFAMWTYWQVEVVNTTLPGDDPRRIRDFRYYGVGGVWESKIWLSWWPYVRKQPYPL